MNRTAGCADAPKRDNAASRLDSATEATKTLSDEAAKTVNLLREALIGKPTPADPTAKPMIGRAVEPGLFGTITMRVEDSNRTLNYVLDELRTVLGEIQ